MDAWLRETWSLMWRIASETFVRIMGSLQAILGLKP